MNFTFSEEQHMFCESVTALLKTDVTPEYLRGLWDSDTGHDVDLWQRFVAMGLLGMCVPEKADGLGLNETDCVLIAEACGQYALAQPLVDSVLVVAPLLFAAKHCDAALTELLSGKQHIAIATQGDASNHRLVANVHIAEYLLWFDKASAKLYMPSMSTIKIKRQASIDPSRRLFAVIYTPRAADEVCADAIDLWQLSCHRGGLGVAAQLLGATQAMLNSAVAYSLDRKQFNKAIGSFQAVKHMMADVAIALEFARPLTYRAAAILATDASCAAVPVAAAKIAAMNVSLMAVKNCIQVFGAMGYTWEVDLQIWMKRVWALQSVWGDRIEHKKCIHDYLNQCSAQDLGAGTGVAVMT